MSDVVFLSDVRLSFPHLAEPQRQPNGKGGERVSYNADFIMPATHPGYVAFFQKVNELALAKWVQNAAQVLQMCQADPKKRCWRDGTTEKINGKTFQPYDGYAGNVSISAGSKNMPQIIDPQGNAVDPANTMQVQALARKMYGGCRVNVAIKPWLQQNDHGYGVRADLVAVQFLRDDTPFGEGAVDVSGIFGATPAAAAAPAGFPPVAGAPAAPAWAPPVTGAPAMPGVPFPGAQPQAPAAPAWAPPAAPGAPSWM